MIKVDWKKDYKREFICPKCEKDFMKLDGSGYGGEQIFKCCSCGATKKASCFSRRIWLAPDTNLRWVSGQKVSDFICPEPECNSKTIEFYAIQKCRTYFKCSQCHTVISGSVENSRNNRSRFSNEKFTIMPFNYDSNTWDLRSINCSIIDESDTKYMINFEPVKYIWFRILVKKYIYYLCKVGMSLKTINTHMSGLRSFSFYLSANHIIDIEQINRSLILDFISCQTTTNITRLRIRTLRDFLTTGTIQKWFKFDQDIIRDEDYPKLVKASPDPMSDTVRKQIENKLHLIPLPIARMWIIGFFTAMRPAELASLKKDCLIQEGDNWKIIWNRSKGKDQHEVPVSRVIAKVVQEQQEYIHNLWGLDWDYLFCHYRNLSTKVPSQPKIKPVKIQINSDNKAFIKCIRCLINAENIKDENGRLAKFTASLIRPTRLTQLFEQGHDLAVVSAWAGHKELATTSLYYIKVSCELIEKEAGHIQKALFNYSGNPLYYESMPDSFWKNPTAHKLDLPSDHINTPIYGYCGLPLDQRCDKFRACYTCSCFVATQEKLPLYKKVLSQLTQKKKNALADGHDVLVEQFSKQAEQLDKIINALSGVQ